jgi:hypothetical protein
MMNHLISVGILASFCLGAVLPIWRPLREHTMGNGVW